MGKMARKTAETDIKTTVYLNGTGEFKGSSTNKVFDHFLAQLAKHGSFSIDLSAVGDTETGFHHTIEDIGIVLGQAFLSAFGDKSAMRRMGWASVPMDEALAEVSLDLSGRGSFTFVSDLSGDLIVDLPGDLIRHFLEVFAIESRISLHVELRRGTNPHHKAEAIFKALGRALSYAVEKDPRRTATVPSTKGSL